MNTGMQDALNLAWKLAHVMDGRAGDGLLDAYARQRLEAIQATAQATDQSTRVIARLHRDPAAVAPLLPRMANRRLWRGPLPRGYAGLGLRHALPALTGSGEGFAPRPAVGAMLPALSRILKSAGVLAAGQGDAARAHVLSLLGPQVELPEGALAAWQAWRTDWSAHARSLAIDGLDAGLVASSGLQPGELMLVLPCGLVAWHGRIEELPSLTATAMAVLHPAEPPPGPPSSFPPPSFSSDHQHEHIH